MTNIKEKLMNEGFEGFVSVKHLKSEFSASCIPNQEGVYHILRLNESKPTFLATGTGGYFKKKNPNVDMKTLELNWVEDEPIVYIGKATDLNKRLQQYMQFGCGKNVGHYGGRYIWQLEDSDELIVCWKRTANSGEVESKMIAEFKKSHNGKRPFANLVG